MMAERFGDAYRDYAAHTFPIVPGLFWRAKLAEGGERECLLMHWRLIHRHFAVQQ
jgi:hypothetical protein